MNYINKKIPGQDANIRYLYVEHRIIVRSFLLEYFTEDEIMPIVNLDWTLVMPTSKWLTTRQPVLNEVVI